MPIQKQKVSIKYCCHIQDNNMLNLEKLIKMIISLGHEKFRAGQIMDAIYRRGVQDFDAIIVIPADLREKLAETFQINSLTIIKEITSADKSAVRYLLKTVDNHNIETVLMKFRDNRNTVCVSSQIGCRLGCKFCATGRLKFGRDLTSEEICDQVLTVQQRLIAQKQHITNIVYMGMGEPLMNYENVMESVRLINDKKHFGIGARSITVSTAGIAPEIIRLSKEPFQINLAVSLHAPNQQVRESIMPVAKIHNLEELMDACRQYTSNTGRRITYEYVMLEKINDSPAQARELSLLLKDGLCHVNLIPYNATGIPGVKGSPKKNIDAFRKILEQNHIAATVRVSLGRDIYAACGQLANNQ